MGLLAVLAIGGGLIEIPGVDKVITNFLEPAFAGSRFVHAEPSVGSSWIGLIVTPIIALIGIAIVYRLYVARRGSAAVLQRRFAPVHRFLVNKWYFDELIDLVVVRPALMLGRLGESVLERIVIGQGVTGSATGAVRAGSAIVRRAQTGFLRYYAAAIVLGLSGMALYFLLIS
jgi:NADH-quinone oxidoreductase subunit L